MKDQKEKLLYKELTGEVLGAFFAVYNALGFGFLENAYVAAFAMELGRRGILVQREVPLHVLPRTTRRTISRRHACESASFGRSQSIHGPYRDRSETGAELLALHRYPSGATSELRSSTQTRTFHFDEQAFQLSITARAVSGCFCVDQRSRGSALIRPVSA
jgi:hypothetical protein